MLADLILGIAAGAGAPYAEPKIKQALEGMLLSEAPMTATELRLVTFALLLLAAAVLSLIFGEGDSVPLAIGAVIGVFGPRIIDRVQKRPNPDYDTNFDKD